MKIGVSFNEAIADRHIDFSSKSFCFHCWSGRPLKQCQCVTFPLLLCPFHGALFPRVLKPSSSISKSLICPELPTLLASLPESVIYSQPGSPTANCESNSAMSHAHQSRLAHLALLLQEAQTQHKLSTRKLEESYHALRTSTRLLERRWLIYSNELERELNDRSRKDVPSGQANNEDAAKDSELDTTSVGGDTLLNQQYSYTSSQPSDTGEPLSSPRTRPRSNILQTPRAQPPSNVQGPREMLPATQTFPSRYNTTPSRSHDAHELQGPRLMSSPKANIPTRHASLPTREYLVSLNEQSGRQSSTNASSIHLTSPKGLNRPPTPHPQHHHISGRAEPDRVNVPPPIPPIPSLQYTNSYVRSRPGLTTTDQVPGRVYTVEQFQPPMTHETLTYEPGVQGHWGGPSVEGNSLNAGHGGITRGQGSGGRTRLQKKRKSDNVAGDKE